MSRKTIAPLADLLHLLDLLTFFSPLPRWTMGVVMSWFCNDVIPDDVGDVFPTYQVRSRTAEQVGTGRNRTCSAREQDGAIMRVNDNEKERRDGRGRGR